MCYWDRTTSSFSVAAPRGNSATTRGDPHFAPTATVGAAPRMNRGTGVKGGAPINSKERRRLKRKAAGTDQGKAPNSSGGATQWSQATNLPTVRFWGWEAAEEYATRLADLLGPDCGVHTAETFCRSNGC